MQLLQEMFGALSNSTPFRFSLSDLYTFIFVFVDMLHLLHQTSLAVDLNQELLRYPGTVALRYFSLYL
jgi:hypothetical protein